MKNKFFKQRSFYAVFLSVVLSVVLVAGAAGAVTTISTNISTGGTLTATGNAVFNSNVNLGDAAATDNDLVYLYGTTTVIGAQSFVFGSSTSTSIAGQAAGSVYFDSTNGVLRLYNGSDWGALASSTDAAGGLILTDGTFRVQLNDWSTNYLTFGTTTADIYDSETTVNGRALLTLQATSTLNVPLRILSASTTPGSVNVFEVLSGGDDSKWFVIDSDGQASSTKSLSIGNATSDNTYLFVGGMATTTGSTGAFTSQGGLTINGNTTLGDTGADTLTLTANATTSNAFQVGLSSKAAENGDLYVSGLATTTGATGNIATQGTLTVGGDVSGTAIDRIFAGICLTESITTGITITASSTQYIHCTGATGVTVGDRVLVTASSSLPTPLIVQAASSTDTNVISIRLYNPGYADAAGSSSVVLYNAADATQNFLGFDFWAFR